MRVVALFCLVAAASAAIRVASNGEMIDGQYIVMFKDGASQADMDAHLETLIMGGAKVLFRYKNTPGYAVQHSEDAMLAVSEDAIVDFVEQDQVARALCQSDSIGPGGLWGLGRSSSSGSDRSTRRYSQTGGAGTDIYIIDTGIMTTHNDFGSPGRARHAFDCTGEGPGDGNGHGTHCAGTAGGDQYGLAPNADLMAVKVLGRTGSGTFACVIAGIDFVAGEPGRNVGSLSLGGGFSAAVNNAVDAAVRAGAAMSSASGNSNTNACNFSPASAPLGLCVNSITNTNARSGFSNFGTCSDMFAPGSSVLSAWIGSNTATNTISGTSMACPHVTGIIAETWSANPSLSGSEVQDQVVRQAVTGQVTNPGAGSPNVLGQTSCAV